MRNTIELLAPVGGIEHFFAAVENGADAIYLGGHKFNARIKAENFTMEELSDVLRYAHLRNVKVYVTVNTLLFDRDFSAATDYCCELYYLGVDAIIVQDLGLAWWVKNNLPNLPLHLSTQGTVYNLSGVQTAKTLGFSRVVLARETSLDEIKHITAESELETEMFVHGALCMCYSGQCQMSRVIGGINGRSANKGLCAQPCRLPYQGKNEDSIYPLSPKDLCMIDYLGEIVDSGISSLKIEGRLKSPEYVAIVTGIYRKYLDQYLSSGKYHVSEEDRKALRQIFSRGDFTEGYLFRNPEDEILSGDLPKHQGIYVGKIVDVLRGKNLIDVRMSDSLQSEDYLSLGDGIEIRNEELVGNLVTYVEDRGNQIIRIGDVKGHVLKGQDVYRTSQSSLLKKARASYEGAAFTSGKSYKRVPIDLEMELRIGAHPTLKITEPNIDVASNRDAESEESLSFIYTDESAIVEKATNRPLENSLAEKQLRKTGSTCFAVRNVAVQIETGSTISVSTINKLRRDALDAFCEYKETALRRKHLQGETQISDAHNSQGMDAQISSGSGEDFSTTASAQISRRADEEKLLAFYIYEIKQLESYDFKSKMNLCGVATARVYLPLQDFMKLFNDTKHGIDLPDYLIPIPYISNISKGKLDSYLKENFDEIVYAVKDTGIAIGNLGWIKEFTGKGINVFADYGLNLSNDVSKEALSAINTNPVAMSLECNEEGDWPIMVTEHPIKSETLTDRMNQPYDIVKNKEEDKWMIFKRNKSINDKTLLERWNKSRGEFRIYISPKS